MGILALAALWGFAEATLFFVVPDVLLSWLAVAAGTRTALKAALVAALAAAVGGACVVLAARIGPDAVLEAMSRLPGIDAALIDAACTRFTASGMGEAFRAAFAGVPYKLYAACQGAGRGGAETATFLALTPAIRLPRFVFAVLVAGGLGAALGPLLPLRARLVLTAVFWLTFYAVYWSVMP